MKLIMKTNKYISLFCLLLFILIIFVPFNVYGAEETEELKDNEEIKNPFYDYRKDRAPKTSNTSSSTNTSETQNKVISDTVEQSKEKKEETNTAPEKKELIKILDKRIEPSFYWQGLILAGNKYKILLEFNNQTHIMSIGDKLDGYQIINVDSNKITLSKDNYIYYLNMGRE